MDQIDRKPNLQNVGSRSTLPRSHVMVKKSLGHGRVAPSNRHVQTSKGS